MHTYPEYDEQEGMITDQEAMGCAFIVVAIVAGIAAALVSATALIINLVNAAK